MRKLVRTDDTATEQELRELFSMEPDEELYETVQVCAGEWRFDGEGCWRFYSDPEWEDEAGRSALAEGEKR